MIYSWLRCTLQVEERYIVDLATFSTLHPNNSIYGRAWEDELGAEALASDEPPDEKFNFLVPRVIKAYNLRLKKWFDLEVDRISEVRWNVEAFQNQSSTERPKTSSGPL